MSQNRGHYRVRLLSLSVVREPDAGVSPLLSDPAAVAALFRQLMADDDREHFWALYLNSQNRLIAAHEVSVGTLSASLVHPREVFKPALLCGAASVIIGHNHPSGEPAPSQEDMRLTRQLAEAAKLLDLRLLDHVIIGSGTDQWVSLAQRGVL